MLCTEFEKLHTYLKENRWPIAVSSVLLLLTWGPWLFDTTPKIDTEALINTPHTTYDWLDIGRQGGIFTEYVFGLRWFNPYLSTLGGYLLLCIAGILLGYLLWRAGQKSQILCATFGLLYFTAPILAEQFYFQMQIFKVAWAYILCVIAAGLSYVAVLRRSWVAQGIAIACMLWCFSTYQAFVILYISIVVCCFVLLYQRWTLEKQRPEMCYFRCVVSLGAGFLASYVLNTIITKLFFSSSGYLQKQVAWNTQTAGQCLRNILSHIKNGLCGSGPFFTPLYSVLALAVLAMAVVRVCRSGSRHAWGLYLAAAAGLQVTPFLLTVVLGTAPTTRAQLIYPMVLAGDLVILAAQLHGWKQWRVAPMFLAVVICWTQVATTERLLYTDAIRSQEDSRLASAIEYRISEVADEKKPVAIVGVYQNHLNNAAIRGEIIGLSAFWLGSDAEPHYFWSGARGINMFQTLGFDWTPASQEQVVCARKQALTMPSWPMQGSVVDAGDYVIVKLSEDNWPEELNG